MGSENGQNVTNYKQDTFNAEVLTYVFSIRFVPKMFKPNIFCKTADAVFERYSPKLLSVVSIHMYNI
jgi:hypothetical protein